MLIRSVMFSNKGKTDYLQGPVNQVSHDQQHHSILENRKEAFPWEDAHTTFLSSSYSQKRLPWCKINMSYDLKTDLFGSDTNPVQH